MSKLTGTVGQAAIGGQTVDSVILMKEVPHTGMKQVVEVPNGLDVGLVISEEEDTEQIRPWRDLTCR